MKKRKAKDQAASGRFLKKLPEKKYEEEES